MSWTDTTIASTNSIKRHQYNINTYVATGTTWDDIIDVAKQKMGNDIIGRMNNYLDGLDNIQNTQTLLLAHDYLSLGLIYTNLSNTGLYDNFIDKKNWYFHLYNIQITQAIPRIKIDGYQPYSVAGQFRL